MTITNVYIDGFNLYYGCLRRTPFRWLDVSRLSSLLLPRDHRIHRIRYFTARVSKRPDNLDAPTRQDAYLRALATIPNLTVAFGHFLKSQTMMPLVKPLPDGTTYVRVVKTEEKGSDVNLACHLLLDAFRGDCDAVFIISNDSDLLEPIRIARKEFGLAVGIGCPHEHISRALLREAGFVRKIRRGALGASQFPSELFDTSGRITKPATW